MKIDVKVLEKWNWLIDAAKKYWVDSIPTGLSDDEFNQAEERAFKEDGFYVRDYVMENFLKGSKSKNSYIEKIKKYKVTNSTMLNAIEKTSIDLGIPEDELWCDLKYDGSSIAIYLDSKTGRPIKAVTVGNTNLTGFGVDQTWKLIDFLPKSFPRGIIAIQAEALIDTERLKLMDIDEDKARQKANGLINSKNCNEEVENLLTLRAFRYYTDNSIEGNLIKSRPYGEVLRNFKIVTSKKDGHILFAPAQTWTLKELKEIGGNYTETDKTVTSTGTFLNDGWVIYNNQGVCQRALKYEGAGSGTEAIKTKVKSIQWNDQSKKGKDSWSANVIIEPVEIKGCIVRKPSAGSVKKLITNNITPGAEVGIILANSTIPKVGDVFSGGNGNFQYPKCSCGYQMSDKDIFGSNLKCGNQNCSERLSRMKNYVSTLTVGDLPDLNKLLVIDRWDWGNVTVDFDYIKTLIINNKKIDYYNYLKSFLKTNLQIRNLDLVWLPSWKALGGK